MRIAVCDGDSEIVDFLTGHLLLYSSERNRELKVSAFTDSRKLLSCGKMFDIAILCVEMPDINGIDLGKRLLEKNPNLVLIYITSHKEYLDDALNINAARFFEKPVDLDRLYNGLDNIIERINKRTVKLFVKDKNKVVRINSDDIMCIEIDQTGHRKTRIITENREYISANKISFWEEKLLNSSFVRTHKSYMVNLNHVTKYDYVSFELANGYTVPISRSYQAAVHTRFAQFTIHN